MSSDKGRNFKDLFLIAFLICLAILFSTLNIQNSFITNLPINEEGSVSVSLEDKIDRPLILYFSKLNNITSLSTDAFLHDTNISLTSTIGFNDGDYIILQKNNSLDFDLGEQIGAPVGSNITIDTPLGFNWTSGSSVVSLKRDLNVDGSSKMQRFIIQGPNIDNASFHITRIIFQMTCTDTPDWSEFCDITNGLTNGIILRKVDGDIWTIFNIKSNSELANTMYDLTVYEQAKVFNTNGIVGRLTFAGENKLGVAIELKKTDILELLIQDDLSSLLSFRVIAEGHVKYD